MTAPAVTLHPRGVRRLTTRHPWIFADDVRSADGAAHGDVVRLADSQGRGLGYGFFSSRSKITLRVLTLEDALPDVTFFARRIDLALARRAALERWEARRLLFAESDGIPGFIADIYGTHLVVQATTAATERLLPSLVALLRERLPIDSALARNDASVRRLEGLGREVVPVFGTTPERVVVGEGAIRYAADPWRGQKTGAFLDQRENRLVCGTHAKGRVLDAFSYHGSFALHAARAAREVVAVDASADALARGRENARENGLTNVTFVEGNVFDDLRARADRGERFDLVLLDPPAFAKSRVDVPAARRGYKDVNLRGFRVLAPGGVLMTSSCSYHMDETEFEHVVRDAAADAGRDVVVLERRGQAADHPVRLAFPESRYLKCLVLRDAGAAP
ncbi:MAG TPA: class I SAM-dependent rRNA methyltransferase [Candidatus Polarisedimenticolaceae bacterium]|nr:class I SAM-dependent rRNA methyltransferase [Candidatus Polarisedimenticolaceae bacterium]